MVGTKSPAVASTAALVAAGGRWSEAGYLVLRELSTSAEPVGCTRVCTVLAAAGIAISEASASRLLRRLDMAGLTEAQGKRGRVLTPAGRSHLAALEAERRRSTDRDSLLDAVRTETIADLVDLVHARRGVEAEIARLAAQHITPTRLRALARAVEDHLQTVRRGGDAAATNRAVHRLIAEAARNRILQAMLNLLLENQELMQASDRSQLATHGQSPEDHAAVLQALASRDPERAAAAARAHLDRILRVVELYERTRAAATADPQQGGKDVE